MKLTKPQRALCASTKDLNLFLAGQGSGKTQCAGAVSSIFISKYPDVRGLIAANTHDQLNRSTLFRIRTTWEEFGIIPYHPKNSPNGNYVVGVQPPVHFNTKNHKFSHYHNIISFANGKVIYIGSLENYKSLDGMEVGWAILDETKDTREEALREVILGRLRQKGLYLKKIKNKTTGKEKLVFSEEETEYTFNPLYIFTSPAKVRWLNEFFELDDYEEEIKRKIFSKTEFYHKQHKDKCIVISSSYSNEENLPDGYIQKQINNQPSHLIDMLVYGSPFSKSGGEFYKTFDREKHVKPVQYNPNLDLHISFDENFVPYAPCGIWQIEQKKDKNRYLLKKICEIDLKDPKNNTFDICKEIKKRFGNHSQGVLIYGDATSQKGDPKLKRTSDTKPNFYSIVKKELISMSPKFKVPKANPAVVNRAQFMNAIFEDKIFEIEINIDPSCKNTINDYIFLKEDDKGKKLKEKTVDKLTKVSYEKYGHDSDLDEYFICQSFKTEFKKFLKPQKTENKEKPIIKPKIDIKKNRI